MIDTGTAKEPQPGTFAAQAQMARPVLDVRGLQVQFPTRDGNCT